MAEAPTEVNIAFEVDGNGPPCTIACATSTPVGKPLNSTRPALRSTIGNSFAARSRSPSRAWTVTVS